MFQTASYTDPGGRPCNEDCTAVQEREGKLCLVVADGLGGHGGGAQASARAAEILCAHWDGRPRRCRRSFRRRTCRSSPCRRRTAP